MLDSHFSDFERVHHNMLVHKNREDEVKYSECIQLFDHSLGESIDFYVRSFGTDFCLLPVPVLRRLFLAKLGIFSFGPYLSSSNEVTQGLFCAQIPAYHIVDFSSESDWSVPGLLTKASIKTLENGRLRLLNFSAVPQT